MASSSSHSTTTMYTGEHWEHDVFLCFRGEDTRHGFISHLRTALVDKQIKTFIDDELDRTKSIDELISILEKSAVSIVVFSENFADSSWCLKEVATISRRMQEVGHRVLPVFYNVDPEEVTDDSGSYAAAIDDEKLESSSSLEERKEWKAALKAVGKRAGHTSTATPNESELVNAIVEAVQKQLIDVSPSILSEGLVGMGSRIFDVERLLAMDKVDDTRVIGLWGLGGLGKTTLAEACYNRQLISSTTTNIKYYFIRNINQKFEKQHKADKMVLELYLKLLSESNLSREDLDNQHRRARLSRSKVFIVLDDVDNPGQLDQLALGNASNLTKLFVAGSRIIVTTRNNKVLQNAKAEVYDMECLNGAESIQLFSLRAFEKNSPTDNWMHLSSIAVSYCKGNPLVLKVLGRLLFRKDRDYWESVLAGFSLIKDPSIHDILRRSYDQMEDDERGLFLDVAYFLHGISRSRLVGYMATHSAYAKVEDMIDKSLLICVSSKDGEKIEMHDLVKEMAVNIVNEEPKFGKRSRLVDPDDIHKLLATTKVESWKSIFIYPFRGIEMMVRPRRKKSKITCMHREGNCVLEGLRTTEGISLDLSKAKEMCLEANAFEGMDSLTFLKFYGYGENTKKIRLLVGGLDSLPDELRWLHWDGYPSKSLPWRFYPQHLTHLIIKYSPITKCWGGFDQPKLVNLVVLNLSYCINLNAIPDLSCSLQLEELLLRECKSLVEVPSHVQYLDKLITLDLGSCGNLESLPSKLNSKFLKHVRINRCPKVKHCPEINSTELMELDLEATPIRELPNAIYTVKEGGILRLYGENITHFPALSASLYEFKLSCSAVKEMNSYDHHQASSSELLPKFYWLSLVDNSQLKGLPKNIWNMVSSALTIWNSPLIESLPEFTKPVNGLSNNLLSLESLWLTGAGIKSLPSSIQELGLLGSIVLRNCKSLESIPSSIHKLPRLYSLRLRGCGSIVSLPELPPSLFELDVGGCKSLQALPSNVTKLSWRQLIFDGCPQLDRVLPDEIVANFPVHALLLSHSPWGHRELHYSGSEIPEWFACKSMNDKDASCVTVQLPPANYCTTSTDQLIKGIAFGVVWSSDASDCRAIMRCECNFGTVTVASWGFNWFGLDKWDGMNSSDNVLLWYHKEASGDPMEKVEEEGEGEAWYVKYAGHTVSFRFHLISYWKKLKGFKIKRCGVSLVY